MFDVLTVAAMVDELQAVALDGRVQKLGLVDATTIAAEVYAHGRRRALVASADTDGAGIWLADRLPSSDPSLITPFGLQLRKYVRGGFLIGIDQPPLERVIRLSIVKRLSTRNDRDDLPDLPIEEQDEHHEEDDEPEMWGPDMNRVDLVVEIMGRHSNLVLVDAEGRVMESAKRVTSSMSRVRPILPKVKYTLPPVPDKPDPRRLTSASAESLLATMKPGAKLSDGLVRGMRGVSPQAGREIAFRVTGAADAPVSAANDLAELARVTRNLYEPLLTRDWGPVVYEQEGEPIAYSAIPLGYLAAMAEPRPVQSISEAVDALRETGLSTGPRDHAQRRERLIAAIDRERDKVGKRLHSLRDQLRRSEQAEQLRTWGEMIFGYLWQIQPGDTQLKVDGMVIPLDPALSAKDQAQEYFEEYRKAQRAGSQVPEHVAGAETELEYLGQLRVQVEQAEGFAAIESLRQEFEEHTGGRQPVGERAGSKSKKQPPRRVTGLTEANGNMIYLGRSGRENDQVTFDIGGAEDTWVHARGVPGSHVIIRWQRPSEEDDARAVETAAALAAYYSSGRESGQVEVDVTRRKNVRKIKGAGPGMVTYRNERTILVKPEDEAALKKAGRLD
jgi:predicted ribosome quality control (RQC) complex YloA/Tae2 family protein